MSISDRDYKSEIEAKTEGILLKVLPISTRLFNCLRRGGYFTLKDVMLEDASEFNKLRNFGAQSADELEQLRLFVISADRITIEKACEEGRLPKLGDEDTFKENSVIEVALCRLVHSNQIMFINEIGEEVEDIEIIKAGFDIRTSNSLLRNGIKTLKEVAITQFKRLNDFQWLGKKAVDDIIALLQKKAVIREAEEIEEERVNAIVNRVKEYYSSIFPENSLQKATNELKLAAYQLCVKEGKTFIDETEEVIEFAKIKPLSRVFKNYIRNSISKYIFAGTDVNAVFDIIAPQNPELYPALQNSIDELIQDNTIRDINGKLYIFRPFLKEWIDTLDESHKIALNCRCDGMTLEETGARLGLTRERIRQIINNSFKHQPRVYEDDYKEVFEAYGFSDEQFCVLFQLEAFQVNYLKIKYKKGHGDVQSFLIDSKIPEIFKDRVKEAFKHEYVMVDGECVPLKREQLLKSLLETNYSDKECSVDEFEVFYETFLKENDLSGDERLLFPSSRALEARIIDYPYTLSKQGKRIRYYDTTLVDINEFIDRIGFEKYDGTEVSALKIFRDSPEVMETYDIRDECELHNLLRKKYAEINNPNFVVLRMPFINFGGDRESQVEDLLLQVSPISNIDLAREYEDRYGVRAETALANFFQSIAIYYDNGIYDVGQIEMSDSDYRIMQRMLTEDFYLWKDVVRIYKRNSVKPVEEAVNAMTLKKLGYKVYSQYIVKATYPSADAFFTEILTRKDVYNANDFPEGMRSIQAYYQAFIDLRDKLDIVEIDKDIYAKFSYLQKEYGIKSREELFQYGFELASLCPEDVFSIGKIFQRVSRINQWGMRNTIYFLNSLIRVQKGIRTGKVVSSYIASRHGVEVSQIGLISFIINDKGELSIKRLQEKLVEDYEVQLERSRIIYLAETSDLLDYDGIFGIITSKRDRACADYSNGCYLSKTVLSEIIYSNYSQIQRSSKTLSVIYWKERYAPFLHYCFDHNCFCMKDLLNIDFADIYKQADELKLSRGLLPEIVSLFSDWVIGLTKKEEPDPDILDLFFK